jgi:hypothetical protein
MFWSEAFVAFGFGGWGLAASIGLLKTKVGRVSTLVCRDSSLYFAPRSRDYGVHSPSKYSQR